MWESLVGKAKARVKETRAVDKVRDKTCPACGEAGHFKVKCPKMSTGHWQDAVQHPKDKGNGFENRSRRNHEVNLVSADHKSDDLPVEQPKCEYAFAAKHNGMSAEGMVLLKVGRVQIPDVLIHSGATCNLMGCGTWEWLKKNGVECVSHKEEKLLFAYGSQEPLPTEIESSDKC